MENLAAHYFVLAYLVCLGVTQAASARSGLIGLLIVPNIAAAYLLGLALPTAAFIWFGLSGAITVPGDLGHVEGAQQFGLFLAGAGGATGTAALLASVTQMGKRSTATPEPGMEGFRSATLLQLLIARRSRLRSKAAPPQ